MAGTITARNLYDDLRERLQLHWLHGPQEDEAYSISRDDLTVRPAAVGFLNLIHPNKVQVMGFEEIDYLDGLDDRELELTITRMFGSRPLAAAGMMTPSDAPSSSWSICRSTPRPEDPSN